MRTRSLGFAVAFVVRLGADRECPRVSGGHPVQGAGRESRSRLSQVSLSALLSDAAAFVSLPSRIGTG